MNPTKKPNTQKSPLDVHARSSAIVAPLDEPWLNDVLDALDDEDEAVLLDPADTDPVVFDEGLDVELELAALDVALARFALFPPVAVLELLLTV